VNNRLNPPRVRPIQPVALVDGGALHDGPAPARSFQPIEEPRIGGHIGEHVLDLLAHQDHDIGLGHGALARNAHEPRENVVLGALSGIEAARAAVDEFAEAAAEPGHGDLAVGRKGCE
jgi:hypothetical protein